MTITCLIADDQEMVRVGFSAWLNAQPGLTVVGQAADGAEAVSKSRQLHPHVVLMDVRMPVMDGLEATRQILDPPPGLGPNSSELDLQCLGVPASARKSVRVGCPLGCPVILRGTAVRLAVGWRIGGIDTLSG